MKKTSFRKLLAMPSYSIKSVFMEYLKLLKLPYYDECCSNNNGYPVRYTTQLERFNGSTWQIVPTGSSTIPLSSITAATAANSISNGANQQVWSWTGLPNTNTTYGIKFSQTELGTKATVLIEGNSNTWSANILRIEDVNPLAGGGSNHTISQFLSPNLPIGSIQNALAFGKNQSSYNLGYVAYVHTGENVNTNRVAFSLHGVAEILTVVGTNRVGIGQVTAPTAPLDINGNTIRLRTAKTPASASDTGNQGDIAWDTDYMYVCVATNTWKRTPLSTW